MSHGPPPKPPQQGQPAAPPPKKVDVVETSDRNKFQTQQRTPFQPTPIKRATGDAPVQKTGEMINPIVRPHPKPTGQKTGGTPSSTSNANVKQASQYLMPGAGAPIVEEPVHKQLRPGQKPPAAKPAAPAAGAPAPGAKPGFGNPTSKAGAPAAAKPPEKKAPAKPAGLITQGDVLGYQGRLPIYVGRPADGNPMIDAEDARFTFDPKGQRVQFECKVAAIMMKAACLHLGLPPPDRGPRRFNFIAMLKPDVVGKHLQKLFDGNLEVRLGAVEAGRPVLLDMTMYENFHIAPDA